MGACAVMVTLRRKGVRVVQMRAVHMAVHGRTGSAGHIARRRRARTARHIARWRARQTNARHAHIDTDAHAGFRVAAAKHHQRHEGHQEGTEDFFHHQKSVSGSGSSTRRAPSSTQARHPAPFIYTFLTKVLPTHPILSPPHPTLPLPYPCPTLALPLARPFLFPLRNKKAISARFQAKYSPEGIKTTIFFISHGISIHSSKTPPFTES